MWPPDVLRAWPGVYRRLYNRLRRQGVQPVDAEEISAQATLNAAEVARSQAFVDDAHCENWMLLVARRRATDELRRRGRRGTVPLVEEAVADLPPEPNGWDQIVRRCWDRLSPRQRLLLSLLYAHALALREAAELLLPADGRTENARLLAIRRERDKGLDELRRGLEAEGLDPGAW